MLEQSSRGRQVGVFAAHLLARQPQRSLEIASLTSEKGDFFLYQRTLTFGHNGECLARWSGAFYVAQSRSLKWRAIQLLKARRKLLLRL